MTSHKAALWRQKCTESDDWRTTVAGGSANVVPPAVNDVKSAAAVRVGKWHLACPVTAGVCDVITGSDVTTVAAYVSVNGREVDVFLGVVGGIDVGVRKAYRLTTASGAGATQYGAAGRGRSKAGSLQPLRYVDRLWVTGASWQVGAATCQENNRDTESIKRLALEQVDQF